MELGADYNVNEQRSGKLVWPRIDLDPSNPQGIENDRPLPGTVNVLDRNDTRPVKLYRDGSVLKLLNNEGAFSSVSLFDVSGRLVRKWDFKTEIIG